MNRWTLSVRSVRTYWRTQLTVAAGLAVAAVVLTGSLIVGDSVRHSLRQTALTRIGQSHFAVLGGDRFFEQTLADRISDATRAHAAPVLLLAGSASHPDNGRRANQVHVLGVDPRFWQLSPAEPFTTDSETAVVNDRLARQLGLAHGDTVVLRIDKPSAIPRDALLSSEEDSTVTLRIVVSDTVSDVCMGRFSLRADQATPYNIFIPIDRLQRSVDLPGGANMVLVAQPETADLEIARVETVVDTAWTLGDAQLLLTNVSETAQYELRSKRVFLAPHVVDVATRSDTNAFTVLTYFVNALQSGTNATPYSMVSAVPPDTFPGHTLSDESILINTWLAEDLDIDAGATLTLHYYVMGPRRQLLEETRSFRVAGVLPLEGLAHDRTLMPDLPGISDSDNCREWEPGFPINLDRIRDTDEAYWEAHQGTPKAFISLSAGQAMWHNRYGPLTAVRFDTNRHTHAALTSALQTSLSPAALGIQTSPIRAIALQASGDAMDFGQLFVSFSFFLVIAALLLSSMLFSFNIEQRRHEAGLLCATGFTRKHIRGLFLREGLILSLIAGMAGVLLGTAYTRALLFHLATTWRDAIGDAALVFHAEPLTLVIGGASSLIVGVLTIHFVLRKQFLLSPVELLKDVPTEHSPSRPQRRIPAAVLPAAMLISAVYMGTQAASAPAAEQGPRFFTSGMILLVAIVTFCHLGLVKLAQQATSRHFTSTGLQLRNLSRRSRRSLATLGLLAAGTFMVIAVSAHRMDAALDASARTSGTGGFAYVAQFTSPVLRDLNDPEAQDLFGIRDAIAGNAPYTLIRVSEGDEASCLNLNRPQRPQLWGVTPSSLAGRFTFMGIDGTLPRERLDAAESPWHLLDLDLGPNRVAAMGDHSSIMWSLGKQIGESLTLQNEQGEPFEIVLIGGLKNSMFQGGLLISEAQFIKHYPSAAGYRMVLIDAPDDPDSTVSDTLNRAFRDQGIELRRATDRLNDFNTLQNTYLAIFQSLGALGLLLGSAGLGIVVLRNVLERRDELALLRAVGYSRRRLHRLVFTEHAILLAAGLLAGILSAALALAPTLAGDMSVLPLKSLGWVLLAVVANGLLWTAVATRISLRGEVMHALRSAK